MNKVAIIYSDPVMSRYHQTGEEKAESGVIEAVYAAQGSLESLSYRVSLVPLVMPLEKAGETVNGICTDIVFNLFEGFPGYPETEAWLPDLLTKKGIAYTGCPPEALSLALNKAKTKEVLLEAGIPTPEHQVVTPEDIDDFHLQFPCIVKPVADDASHGLNESSLVNNLESLAKKVSQVSDFYGGEAIVEEFMEGREFNATVLGNDDLTVLPVSEIMFNLPPDKPHILTFAAKWEPGSIYYKNTPVVCPAEIDGSLKSEIEHIALAAFKIAHCRGYARVDMRLDYQGKVNIIEINPNPDISPAAGAARQAKAAGMTYTDLIARIIELAMNKGI